MRLAHIVPTQNLKNVVVYGYHMVLAPRLATDDEYREVYRVLGSLGHHLIVDNGVAEDEYPNMDFKEVVRLANYVFASEICLPDVLYDKEATKALGEEYAPLVPYHQRMIVPQGENILEHVQCAVDMLNKFGAPVVGVNRAPIKRDIGRGEWYKEFERQYTGEVQFHALGLWLDWKGELTDVRGWCRGLDTGIAAAYAQQSLYLGEGPLRHYSVSHTKKANNVLLDANMEFMKEVAYG